MNGLFEILGGRGSGHHGHKGRPGKVGGSGGGTGKKEKSKTKYKEEELKSAIIGYAGEDYLDMNSYLRSGQSDIDVGYVKDRIKKLNTAFDELGTVASSAKVVYRGLSEDIAGSRGFQAGSTVKDKGFISTTSDRSVGKQFAQNGWLARIGIIKGSKYLDVDSILKGNSPLAQESEIILKPGKFRVTMVDRDHKEVNLVYYGG